VTAFGLWGLLPVFWKQIDWLSPAQVVAMRAVCCVPVLVAVLLVRGRLGYVVRSLGRVRVVACIIFSGLLKQLEEALVVAPKHAHVNVVVPRNNAAVAHSAQQSAPVNPVPEVVGRAKLIKRFKQGHHSTKLFHSISAKV
jgi:hypothetical protein